jgi:membrane protein DedA with SNARE-associated domain
MFGEITTWILELIQSHGILAVILGVIIETVIVPLPSPLIVMTAGYILIPNGTLFEILFSALWISVVAGIAQTVGSYLLYFIGYYGGKPIINKFEWLHGVSWSEIKQFQKKFSKGKKEDLTLITLRAIPIVPLSVISGVAGVIKLKFKRYSIATLIGVIPRNFILALSGFFFSGFYESIAQNIDHGESIMTVFIVLIILSYIVAKKFGLIDKVRKSILK